MCPYPLPRILLTTPFVHGFPVRVESPSAVNASQTCCSDRRRPCGGFLLSSRILASVSASPGMVPNGFRPSHRSPRARRLSLAARSFITVTRRSNSATAPSTCRIRRRVGSSESADRSVPESVAITLQPTLVSCCRMTSPTMRSRASRVAFSTRTIFTPFDSTRSSRAARPGRLSRSLVPLTPASRNSSTTSSP